MKVDDPKLTAYALGEVTEEERAAIETEIATSPEAKAYVDDIAELSVALKASYATEREQEPVPSANLIDIRGDRWFWSIGRPVAIAAILAVGAIVAAVIVSPRHGYLGNEEKAVAMKDGNESHEFRARPAPTEIEGEFVAEDPSVAKSRASIADDDRKQEERIAVTGGAIPTEQEEGPNPVDTYRRDDIARLPVAQGAKARTKLRRPV